MSTFSWPIDHPHGRDSGVQHVSFVGDKQSLCRGDPHCSSLHTLKMASFGIIVRCFLLAYLCGASRHLAPCRHMRVIPDDGPARGFNRG